MMPDPRTPVIVGVGQVIERGDDAPEPVDLLAEAARAALTDAGVGQLAGAIDSIRVVRLLSWRYRDPGALVAERIGAQPRHSQYTTDGGHTPQVLVNQAAADIQDGRADVVLLGGAESWRTRTAYRRRDDRLQWTKQDAEVVPAEVVGADLAMSNEIETALGIVMPVQVYPLFESALRHASGRSIPEHTRHIAELWSRFSEVAATNRYAALPRALTAGEIGTPSAANRVIGSPYTKLLNSNNRVNQAAALVLCSLERAQAMGVATDRLVFPQSGAEANDIQYVSNRDDLCSSPGIRLAGRSALELAGVDVDDIAHVDLYSCFPSAVQVAAAELGLGIERQLTVTGGLTFAGGPWNNYVSHSIATMVDVLRRDPGSLGLCSANGGLLTKHALGIYGTSPPAHGFRVGRPDASTATTGRAVAGDDAAGTATIEAYTVMHDAAGHPETAILTVLLADGRRAWRTSADAGLLAAMLTEEQCGRPVELDTGGHLAVG
jgi:acetyl-CoA C-acetyltransferase